LEEKCSFLLSVWDIDSKGALTEDELAALITSCAKTLCLIGLGAMPNQLEVAYQAGQAFQDGHGITRTELSQSDFIEWVKRSTYTADVVKKLDLISRFSSLLTQAMPQLKGLEANLEYMKQQDQVAMLLGQCSTSQLHLLLQPFITSLSTETASVVFEGSCQAQIVCKLELLEGSQFSLHNVFTVAVKGASDHGLDVIQLIDLRAGEVYRVTFMWNSASSATRKAVVETSTVRFQAPDDNAQVVVADQECLLFGLEGDCNQGGSWWHKVGPAHNGKSPSTSERLLGKAEPDYVVHTNVSLKEAGVLTRCLEKLEQVARSTAFQLCETIDYILDQVRRLLRHALQSMTYQDRSHKHPAHVIVGHLDMWMGLDPEDVMKQYPKGHSIMSELLHQCFHEYFWDDGKPGAFANALLGIDKP
ncbi:unnamed protein product, partial [Chrysoparadoxa australica]